MDINEKLVHLEQTIEEKNKQIQDLMGQLKGGGLIAPAQMEILEKALGIELMPSLDISDPKLKELVKLLHSSDWPLAVDPSLICDVNSEQDKEDRAEGILEIIIDIHLEGLKFLDFGCGEGHVVNRSRLQNPKLSVAYDINKAAKWDNWEKTQNVIYTNDFNIVKSSGPYNVVLLYDVIDHMLMPTLDLVEQLKKVKALLAPNGKVYVRTHPWCSKHGTHLYHQLNKAFVHIVFTRQELDQLGYKQEKTRMVKHPIHEYSEIFAAAGFKINNGPHVVKDKIHPFFVTNASVSQRIKAHFNTSFEIAKKEVIPPLEYQFVDYILG